jgi:hypothetical protein
VISQSLAQDTVQLTKAISLIVFVGQGGNRGAKLERLWETVWAFWLDLRCSGLTWFTSRFIWKPWALATSSTNRICTRMTLLTESRPERSSFSPARSGQGSRLDARPEDCTFTHSCTNYRLWHITPNPLPTSGGLRDTSPSAKYLTMTFRVAFFLRLEQSRSKLAKNACRTPHGQEEFHPGVRPYVKVTSSDRPSMPYVKVSKFLAAKVRPYVKVTSPQFFEKRI